MKNTQIPSMAFLDPSGGNRRDVEELMQRALAILLDHASTAAGRPLLPVADSLPVSADIPTKPEKEERLLAHLQSLLSASMNSASPGYMGHMDSLTTAISALGDFAAALTNNNMLSLEMSPVFSRLEDALLKQFAGLFGLGAGSGGVLSSGGSLSNLLCLAVARNARLGTLVKSLHQLEKPPVLFASEAAHASIRKSVMLLGLGNEGIVPVATNADSQMEVEDLRDKIHSARAAGKHPFCVVATAGTTTTGNIDPLEEVGRVAREQGLWFHVDAVWGGGLIFSAKHRDKLRGIEEADSVTFNPQKMLLVARTSSMALFRDHEGMKRAFRVHFPYMRKEEDFVNLGEIGVQGSRSAEVLKLWLSLRHLGRTGYCELVERRLQLVDDLAAQISKRGYLQLATRPETGILCFRAEPDWLPESARDNWNAELQRRLLRESGIYISLLPFRGKPWLRVVLLNPYTDELVLENLLAFADRYADESRRRSQV